MALRSAFTNFNVPTFGAGAPVLGTTAQDGPYFDTTTTPFNQWVYQPSTNTWQLVSAAVGVGASLQAKFVSNATAGNQTAAAGDMTGAGSVTVAYPNATGGGAAALTTRTGAQIEADLFAALGVVPAVGYSWDLNISNAGANTLTLTAAASGVTLTGGVAITTAKVGMYVVKKTALNAYTFQSFSLSPTF